MTCDKCGGSTFVDQLKVTRHVKNNSVICPEPTLFEEKVSMADLVDALPKDGTPIELPGHPGTVVSYEGELEEEP